MCFLQVLKVEHSYRVSQTQQNVNIFTIHLIWNTITVEDGAFRWVLRRDELFVKREGMKNRSVAVMTNTRAVIT